MTLDISSKRKNEIKNIVYSALLHGGEATLPVKIGNIIRSYPNIKLITYSSQIRKNGITYKELIISAETKDSYVVYSPLRNKYCIYYNDIDINIISSNRVRWNLAHELGHVLLRHHELCSKKKLLRSDIFLDNIDEENYKLAELEANYFAQLILVPHAAIGGFKITKPCDIRHLCKISDKSSRRRYYEFVDWKSHMDANDEYDNRIFRYYFNFIYKRKCKNCDADLIQRCGKYCPICGKKNTLEWGNGTMRYPLLPTHENGKLKECPNCHNEETNINGDYCQICGHNLVNKCYNEDCSNKDVLPSNARFCPICGNQSSFFMNDLLQAWNYNEFNKQSDGFMSIPNGIDEELPFN